MTVEIAKFNDVLKYQLWESGTTLNNNAKPALEVQKIRHKVSSSEQDRALLKEGNWERVPLSMCQSVVHANACTYIRTHMHTYDISGTQAVISFDLRN